MDDMTREPNEENVLICEIRDEVLEAAAHPQQGYRAVKDFKSLSSRFPADPVWFCSPAISIVTIRSLGSQLKAMRKCWVWSFTLRSGSPVHWLVPTSASVKPNCLTTSATRC